MENPEQQTNYWPSVLIGALIVGVVITIVNLTLQYYIAGSEPTMKLAIVSGLSIPLTCLIGLIGGLISTRHYAQSFDINFPIGQGALIGLFTGVAAALISVILGQLWNLVDPTLIDRSAEVMLGMFEMNDAIPAENLADMEANFEKQKTLVGILQGLAISAGVLGFVNLLSGMLGAKLFASED